MDNEMKTVNAERESIRTNEKRLKKERQKHENKELGQHKRTTNNNIQPNIKKNNEEMEIEDRNSKGAWVHGNAVVNDYYHQQNIANRKDMDKNESPAMQNYREHQVAIQEKMLSQQKEQARIQGKNPEKVHGLGKVSNIGHAR